MYVLQTLLGIAAAISVGCAAFFFALKQEGYKAAGILTIILCVYLHSLFLILKEWMSTRK